MALVNPNIALAGTPMQVPNFLGMQQSAAQTQNQLARTDIMKDTAAMDKEANTYNTALSRSKDSLRFVNSPDQYLAWMESGFNDPVLGPVLQGMGVDRQQAISGAMETLRQPGGLQLAIGKSASSIDQLAKSATAQGGQAQEQAQAQSERARAERERAAQQAQIDALMGGGQMPSPGAQAPTAAPVATATPVPPPVDTMQYAPGTPGAVNQLYAGMDQPATPALNALTQQPPMGAPAPAPARGADPRLGQLAQLDQLALQGNALAANKAKTMRAAMKFEKDMGVGEAAPAAPAAPAAVQEYEYAKSQGYPGTFDDFRKEKAPMFETEYSKVVGKEVGTRVSKFYFAAVEAAENLPKIYDTLNQIESSDAITGFGADVLKNVERFRAQFTRDKAAGKRVADTEILDALLGSEVFPLIGALGIGARGLDTPAEQKFLRQVMTGTIAMDKKSLVRLTEIRKNIAERSIDKYNGAVEKGDLDQFFKVQGVAPRKIEKPQFNRTAQTGTARVESDSDYDALPSGTVFTGPDGVTRRKP